MASSDAQLQDFEKLGAFYLGRPYDPETGRTRDEWLLYDSKDLTTHAVCVGMTGSGKTGLCLTLLEEAALDGIPAIAVDPKGDLGNLLLTFPKLRPEDFRPWIDPAEAAREGATPEEYAARTAERWREGLAEWGQGPDRIERLRSATDLCIYTPGGSAGVPLAVLRSFDAPRGELAGDALRERVASATSGLLALLGLAGDPLKSREHILISNILTRSWSAGEGLDLPGIIRSIQSPPFERLGVIDLETFYPARERSELAMSLNALLAAPGFAAWLEGEPLDVGRLLWTREGRPRISILGIAHLSEAERAFFLTLLFNEVVAWMRTQPGTASLRALLYMDEVAGYLPPSAIPPTKPPLLTLLKQARAYGLGVVLATQNPVDLDYKALSNAGTWFLGRLQTDRDKARVLDGLEGASAGSGRSFDRRRIEQLLSGLGRRVFLMNDVHEDGPVLFQTRWALSYLRGPLTAAQIGLLAGARGKPEAGASQAPPVDAAPETTAPAGERPALPSDVTECFVPAPEPGRARSYRPALLGSVDLHFSHSGSGLDVWETAALVAPLAGTLRGNVWRDAKRLADGPPAVSEEPEPGASFAELPGPAARAASYKTWSRQLSSHVYKTLTRSLWQCPALGLFSEPGEDESGFRSRVRLRSQEARDLELAKLRERYAKRIGSARERIRAAEERLGREESQLDHQKLQAAISVGATVFGALFGRKLASVTNVGRATTAARSASRVAREKEDLARAGSKLEEARAEAGELEAELAAEAAALAARSDPAAAEVAEIQVRPRKADIAVRQVALLWRVSTRAGESGA